MSKYSEKELKTLNRANLTNLLNIDGISYSDKLSNAELRALLLKESKEEVIEVPTSEIIVNDEQPIEVSAPQSSLIADLIKSRRESVKTGIKSETTIISDVIFQRRAGKGKIQGQSISQIIVQRRAGK